MDMDLESISMELDDRIRQFDSLSRSIVRVESFLEGYSVENMEGATLDMAEHYLDTMLSNSGMSFESISFEDSSTPASDAAVADSSSIDTSNPSRAEKLKKFAKDSVDKMKDKLKDLPEQIKKYTKLLLETITGSTAGLSNTAKQILDKLDSAEVITGKISGNYSIFEEARPQAAISSLSKGVASLSSEADKSINSIMGTQGATSNLKLYNYKGTEFKFDGTSKFFDTKLKNEKKDVSAANTSDIKQTCENIISLSEAIENLRKNLPNIEGYIDKMVKFNGGGVSGAAKDMKDGGKKAMAVSSFYRNVIGGYIRYSIKVSKAALGYANASLKT